MAADPPLRVLTVLTYYHPHWTGLTELARHIAEGLVEEGAEVSVLASRHDPSLARRETVGGVDVHRLRTAGRISRTMPMPGFPLAILRLARSHDVVHLHSPMAEAGLVRWACRLAGRPLVVTHQGDVVMPSGPFNQAVQRVMRATLASTFRAADRVVTHDAGYIAGSLMSVAGERATAIAPPVAFAPPPPGAAAALRQELGLDDRPLVAFAGRWVEEKGFDVLLRAAPQVLTKVPEAVFAFAGERGVAYERFSERCAPLIDALGPAFVDLGLQRDPQRLAAFYAAADVFVLPSRSDSLAIVQIEALLCGTPLVATDIPGARSVVQTTGAGVLVPPEEPDALADAIVSVLDDPDQFATEVAAVPALYDPSAAVARYRTLLDEVVARPTTSTTVDRLLADELDMAYRRRVGWAMERLDLQPGDRLLDAGTGLGNVLYVAEQAQPGVVALGVDRSVERLGRAEAAGVESPLAQADLLDLPLRTGALDAVLCSEVLEHIDDDRGALLELRRVLRPGGRLVVTVPHADYPFAWDPINRVLERLGRRPITSGPIVGIWTNHVRLYRPDDLRSRLAEAGFVVDEVEEQTHHALPFTHLLLYGVGRALVERGVLSGGAGGRSVGGRAVGLVRGALARVDRRNDHLPSDTRTFVSLVASVHVPGG